MLWDLALPKRECGWQTSGVSKVSEYTQVLGSETCASLLLVLQTRSTYKTKDTKHISRLYCWFSYDNVSEFMCWLNMVCWVCFLGFIHYLSKDKDTETSPGVPSFVKRLQVHFRTFKTPLTFVSLFLVPHVSPSLIHMPVNVLFVISHSCQILLRIQKGCPSIIPHSLLCSYHSSSLYL